MHAIFIFIRLLKHYKKNSMLSEHLQPKIVSLKWKHLLNRNIFRKKKKKHFQRIYLTIN